MFGSMHFVPYVSYSALGKRGDLALARGPIQVGKQGMTDFLALSMPYATALGECVLSAAMTPLINERGLLPIESKIGASEHTGEQVFAVSSALPEWNRLFTGGRHTNLDRVVRQVGEDGPNAVMHYSNMYYTTYRRQFSMACAPCIDVYLVFRREAVGNVLLGVLAGYREHGYYDPSRDGPYFTNEALEHLLQVENDLSCKSDGKRTMATFPTESEMQTYYNNKNAVRSVAL